MAASSPTHLAVDEVVLEGALVDVRPPLLVGDGQGALPALLPLRSPHSMRQVSGYPACTRKSLGVAADTCHGPRHKRGDDAIPRR
eukprot:326438-Prorocentrum_minimum.AAC.1